MKFYMKQKMFSLSQRFDIFNEAGESVFYVENELLSLGRKMHVYETKTDQEVAFIQQKLLVWLPRFEVYVEGDHISTIKKELTFLKPKYTISGLDWNIQGNWLEYDYQIYTKDNREVASIGKKWFSFTDSFEFDIKDDSVNPIAVISVILAIDAVMDSRER